MTTTLLQNTAVDATVYLETLGGSAATSVGVTDVSVSLKKSTDAFFSPLTLTAPVSATATIGSGADGTVTIAVPGSAGNSYTVEVTVPAGTAPLTITKAGSVLTVALSVSGGVPVGVDNTATLVAAAVNALGGEVVATASGTGADPLPSAEGPTALSGGVDGTFTELGSGFYNISLSASDTDTVGTTFLQVTGVGLLSLAEGYYVSAAPSLGTPTTPTTTVYGTILDVSGNAVVGAAITFQAVPAPTIVHPGSFGIGIDSDLVTVSTDTDGYFSISLVTGTTVSVTIPVLCFRTTISVPASSSANLFDI